jgi:hypothetical protein
VLQLAMPVTGGDEVIEVLKSARAGRGLDQ